MLEFLFEVVARMAFELVIWTFLVVPATVGVFCYQLVVQRSIFKAANSAAKVARDIINNTHT